MRNIVFALLFLSAFTPFCRAQNTPGKRPMTFDDLMKMKRLGETAVSPDGKWLVYGVTTVDLVQNRKTTELWVQAIAAGSAAPFKLGVAEPGDSGVQFAADGSSVLFVSGREHGQQVWVADFDAATGTASHAKRVTGLATGADNAIWSPDRKSIVFTSAVYPDCPAIGPADGGAGDKCNADRDAALAANPVKAQIFTHLLYRHWDHFTGDKRSHLFQVLVDGSGMRDLTPHDAHDVPPFSLDGGGCGCAISPDGRELAFTENVDAEPATSISASIFTLDLTRPGAKPVKVSTSAGGNFNPAYSPDGKWLAWRSQERAGYESDRFRLVVYDRAKKNVSDLLEDFKLDNWVDEFSWVADSQHILFVSGDKGEAPVYEVNVTGGDLHRMGKAAGEWSSPRLTLVNGFPYILGTLVRVERPSEVVLGNALELDDTAVKVRVPVNNRKPVEDLTSKSYEPQLVTHLNDALLAQLDLPKMESFWFTAKDGTKVQGFLIRPPGFDAGEEVSVEASDPWRAAGGLGRPMELQVECGVVCCEWIRRRDDQSAGVDRVWAGDCGRRERRLGREAVYRPDGGAGLRRAALPIHR